MKKVLFLWVLALGLALADSARADEDLTGPTQDLVPLSLSFSRVAGELGGQSLRVSVLVRNVGSLPVRGSRGGVRVGDIASASAPLYGPNGVGGYNLGAPIPPGGTGLFLLYAPTGSLRHCQKVRVWIDTARRL